MQYVYRLHRRTGEVNAVLRRYSEAPYKAIVDIGTADGLMLSFLRQKWGTARIFLGIDLSLALLQAVKTKGIRKIQADALQLPLRSRAADVIIATAVIEHISRPADMLKECARVLRSGGLLILTTPDPFLERLSNALGILKDSGHQQMLKISELNSLLKRIGFKVLEARKFMISPVGFPFERHIEKILRSSRLGFLMANQLIVARLE
jgi:ubiquinone/menaquinone biosynthesis C-methylase UbiE